MIFKKLFLYSAIKGLIKQYQFLIDPPQLRDIVLFLEGVYVANIMNSTHEKILLSTTRLAKVIVTIMEVIYSSSAFLYLINPITAFTDSGQYELLLFVFVPGTDPKQPIGYILNLCYQSMMLFFGLAGTCCSDIYCFATVAQLRPMQQIFRQSIRELNEILMNSPYSETALVKMHLRNILFIHKDIKMYPDRVII